MTTQPDLQERVRQALKEHNPREVTMFGGISFMVDERMVAACRRNHELLLRVDPTDRERLLSEPGAHPALTGAGRAMGAGWITVRADALEGDGLAAWLAHAVAFRASQAPTSAAGGRDLGTLRAVP